VSDSVTPIKPSVKPTHSNIGTDVISGYPVVHLEKTLEDCIGDEWFKFEKYEGYEIYSVYPHLVRKIGTDKPISISLNGGEYKNCKINGGYWMCSLNKGVNKLHIIVAEQLIPNRNNKPIMDHFSGIIQNPNKTNLRWVTHIENMGNRKAWLNLDLLPYPSVSLTYYRGNVFRTLYYCQLTDSYYQM
jgi:hypothetical protein